jgi:hypothetical protein
MRTASIENRAGNNAPCSSLDSPFWLRVKALSAEEKNWIAIIEPVAPKVKQTERNESDEDEDEAKRQNVSRLAVPLAINHNSSFPVNVS